MNRNLSAVNNENGYVLVIAIMILTLLTIIGISASKTSTTEVRTSTNSLLYERAFYTAESGLEHLKELLKAQFVQWNAAKMATGANPDWTFALNGSVTGVSATDSDADGFGDYEGGVIWINANLDNVNYSVRVWNNADGGGPASDTDGIIFARSEAIDARGARCSIEQLLEGDAIGQVIAGYNAQQGAGSGKSSTSNDAEKMTDFSAQL
jgi:hypothetical protein